MTLYNAFLQPVQLVQFSGSITYNSSGFAVLPDYSIFYISASMQPIKRSDIRFLPEGTHYADYLQVLTDYPIFVDTTDSSLGNYLIYGNNIVYKIISEQNFLPFYQLPTNHVETMVCKDNRITYNGSILNIPFPEIEGTYAPLFDLIGMANSAFVSPSLTSLWSFQQELQPAFPYCTVTIESVENIDNTNYQSIDINSNTLTTNVSRQLIVKFSFYAQDQLQSLNLMEQFKLNYTNYVLTSNQFQFIGFVEGENNIIDELYEDRTTFHADVRMRFSWIVQETQTSSQTIESVGFSLSIPPVSASGYATLP